MFEDEPTQIHPGFTPKRSTDTLLDYDPSLADHFAALPASDIESLPALIQALETASDAASTLVGTLEKGDTSRGMPEKVYRPTREELVEAEIGRRIKAVVASFPPSTIEEVLKNAGMDDIVVVSWKAMTVKHVGDDLERTYYVTEPKETELDLV